MPVSEAQKRASNKYQAEHMTTLGCKVKKQEATAFKDYAAQRGKTSNTMLKEYVMGCIDETVECDNGNHPAETTQVDKVNPVVATEPSTVDSCPATIHLTDEETAHIEKRRAMLGKFNA